MLVIYRNGIPTVITGWRAWLLMLAASIVMVIVVCLTLGFALTMFTLFVFGLPLVFALAFLVHLFQSRR